MPHIPSLHSQHSWLRVLTSLQPAKWNNWRSGRAAVGVALPLIIGYSTDTISIFLWVSMAYMLLMGSEKDNPYSILLTKALIIAPLSASGFLFGYLSNLPWLPIAFIMAAVAYICALVSSYNASLSIGTMQMLMMATVSLGNVAIHDYAQSALYLLLGSIWYLLLLGIEALVLRKQNQQQILIDLLHALCNCIQQRIDQKPLSYNVLSNQFNRLYNVVLSNRSHSQGRSLNAEYLSRIASYVDQLFALSTATTSREELIAAKTQILAAINALTTHHTYTSTLPQTSQSAFYTTTNELIQTLWKKPTLENRVKNNVLWPPSKPKSKLWLSNLDKLYPGKDTMQSALALSVCVFLAYCLR